MKLRHALLSTVVVTAAVWTAPLNAGGPLPTPGELIVSQCEADLNTLAADYDTAADTFQSFTIAQLTLLDNAGRTNEQLQAYVNRQLLKLDRAEARANARANKLALRGMVRLVNLDETDLITQITDVDDDRDTAVAAIEADADDAQTAIETALDAIINPAP